MRAVRINKADGPGAVTVEDRPVAVPGPGEVRLRVAAAAVNPADAFMWRSVAAGALEPPLTPGLDAAGTIDAVGDGVERLTVGQSVMAVVNARGPQGGAQAELPLARTRRECRRLRFCGYRGISRGRGHGV